MRILVCGGRDYNDRDYLYKILDTFNAEYGPIEVLIHGGATGADTLAGDWALDLGIPVEVYKADWFNEGKSAGFRRNERMLFNGKPEVVIVFPGGRGTFHTKELAAKKGFKVLVYPFEEFLGKVGLE